MTRLIPYRRSLLSQDLFRTMDDFLSDAFSPLRIADCAAAFKVDIREEDKQYVLQAELPGVSKEEIALDLTEDRLTIAVNRTEETENSREGYIHRERRQASMRRCFQLPGLCEEGTAAELKDGILTVTVPKADKSIKKRMIEIQ